MHEDVFAAIAGMGDGIIVMDEDGKITVFNEAAQQMLGYAHPIDNADDRRPYDVFLPDGSPASLRDFPMFRALKGELCDQVELFIRLPEGTERCISVTARPITLSNGRRGAVGVFRDVTRAKELERQAQRNEAIYRSIACNLPHGAVFLFDTEHRILAAYGEKMLGDAGLHAEDLVGKHISAVARPPNQETLSELYRATIAGESRDVETTSGGRTYETHTVPVRDASGVTVAGLALSYDVTQHKHDVRENRALFAKMSTLMEHLNTGLLFEDAAGRVQFVNRAFCEMFGLADGAAIVGRHRNDPIRLPEVLDREAFARIRAQRIEERMPVVADRIFFVDGRIVERDYTPIEAAGVAEGHFWGFRDVTQRERARSRATELSNRDELTGLYNRRGFLTLAEQWLRIAARTKRTPLVLFVDVDGLKPVNDEHGHAVGDRMLRDTADALRKTYRDSDILARLGGDEFVVLAVDATPEHIPLLTNRLCGILAALNASGERPYSLSVSVGTATWDPSRPRSSEELLEEADQNMYEAKRSQRANSLGPRSTPLRGPRR